MPRLLPADDLSSQDLIDLLARLTLHMDDELGKYVTTTCLTYLYTGLHIWRSGSVVRLCCDW